MKILALLISLCFSAVAIANHTLPSWYPKKNYYSGNVEFVDRTVIRFEDFRFELSPTVKVSTETNRKASLSDVIKGQKVRLQLIEFRDKEYVDHIYIMPIEKNGLIK